MHAFDRHTERHARFYTHTMVLPCLTVSFFLYHLIEFLLLREWRGRKQKANFTLVPILTVFRRCHFIICTLFHIQFRIYFSTHLYLTNIKLHNISIELNEIEKKVNEPQFSTNSIVNMYGKWQAKFAFTSWN